jgi:hypothetical protein
MVMLLIFTLVVHINYLYFLHDTSGGVALGGSWSASIDDHWARGSATGENVRGKV